MRIPRFRVALVREGSSYTEYPRLADPKSVADFARSEIGAEDREVFLAVAVDTKNRLIASHIVSVGSLNSSLVHPREVMKFLVCVSASAWVAAHNHPSGDSTPSREDHDVTRRLVKVSSCMGIPMLDHVVVGESDYFSFLEAGLISKGGER